MKLSLWMIANRLRAMEPTVELEENAPVTLNSARLAYATNCVHVYQEEDSVVCKAKGGVLRFAGMDLRTGFEVMQSVFDYYEDWETGLQSLIREERLQEAVELAWQVLQNPLVLFDGNNRVLGITREYGEDALDGEWRYLSRYGYSSMEAVRTLRSAAGEERRETIYARAVPEGRAVAYDNCTVPLVWGDITCGRITLIAAERELNPGDRQLMELIAALLLPAMAQMFYRSEANSTVDVFLNLLLGKPYGDEQLEGRLRYTPWKYDDSFFVTAVRVSAGERGFEYGAQQLQQVLGSHIPGCVVLKTGGDLAIISSRSLREESRTAALLEELLETNPVTVGFSLEGHSIRSLSILYEQAVYAVRSAEAAGKSGQLVDFYDVALDYMLEMPLSKAVGAVAPKIRELWEESRRGDDLVNTLRIYLCNNCSAVKTAADLYIHRNTVLYRVQKVEEQLGLDFHKMYDRSYFLTCIRVMELGERANTEDK